MVFRCCEDENNFKNIFNYFEVKNNNFTLYTEFSSPNYHVWLKMVISTPLMDDLKWFASTWLRNNIPVTDPLLALIISHLQMSSSLKAPCFQPSPLEEIKFHEIVRSHDVEFDFIWPRFEALSCTIWERVIVKNFNIFQQRIY